MKKVFLFLNIEGVLNKDSTGMSKYDMRKSIEKEALDNLEKLVLKYDLKLVVFTTWSRSSYVEYLRWFLGNYSTIISDNLEFVCADKITFDREDSLNRFVKLHKIKKFVVLEIDLNFNQYSFTRNIVYIPKDHIFSEKYASELENKLKKEKNKKESLFY